MTETAAPSRSVERFDSVIARTGKSRRQLYRDIASGKFPQPIQIGAHSIAFYADEVDRWLADRPRVSYATEPAAA